MDRSKGGEFFCGFGNIWYFFSPGVGGLVVVVVVVVEGRSGGNPRSSTEKTTQGKGRGGRSQLLHRKGNRRSDIRIL